MTAIPKEDDLYGNLSALSGAHLSAGPIVIGLLRLPIINMKRLGSTRVEQKTN